MLETQQVQCWDIAIDNKPISLSEVVIFKKVPDSKVEGFRDHKYFVITNTYDTN
jgi:hypothetical protein